MSFMPMPQAETVMCGWLGLEKQLNLGRIRWSWMLYAHAPLSNACILVSLS